MPAYEAHVTLNGKTGRVVVETPAGLPHACKLAVEKCVGDEDPRTLDLSIGPVPTEVLWESAEAPKFEHDDGAENDADDEEDS